MSRKIAFLILLLPLLGVFGQTESATIKGTILSGDETVPFASVYVKNGSQGATSDKRGSYTLKVPAGTHSIQVSSQGYRSMVKEITVTNNQTLTLDFELLEDALGLEEVVVSATRNRVERRNAPVVVSTIQPRLLNATQSLLKHSFITKNQCSEKWETNPTSPDRPPAPTGHSGPKTRFRLK